MAKIPSNLASRIKERVAVLSANGKSLGSCFVLEGIDLSEYRLQEPIRIHTGGPFAYYNIPDGAELRVNAGNVFFTYVPTTETVYGEKVFEPEISLYPKNDRLHEINLRRGPLHIRTSCLPKPEKEKPKSTENKQNYGNHLSPDFFPIGGYFELE